MTINLFEIKYVKTVDFFKKSAYNNHCERRVFSDRIIKFHSQKREQFICSLYFLVDFLYLFFSYPIYSNGRLFYITYVLL